MPIVTVPGTAFSKLNRNSSYFQITAGAAGGFIVGYVFFKFSKLLAICVGTAILTIEMAVETGVVQIDLGQLQRVQFENSMRRISNGQAVPANTLYMDRAREVIISSARLTIAFVGGFFLGFGFS